MTDSGTEQDYNCPNGYACGDQRFIQYEVTDALGSVPVAGIPVTEAFTAGSNSCSGVPAMPAPGGGTTATDGEFNQPDHLLLCSPSCSTGQCPVPGSCQLSVTQRWYANGILVRTNALAYGCKNIAVTQQ